MDIDAQAIWMDAVHADFAASALLLLFQCDRPAVVCVEATDKSAESGDTQLLWCETLERGRQAIPIRVAQDHYQSSEFKLYVFLPDTGVFETFDLPKSDNANSAQVVKKLTLWASLDGVHFSVGDVPVQFSEGLHNAPDGAEKAGPVLFALNCDVAKISAQAHPTCRIGVFSSELSTMEPSATSAHVRVRTLVRNVTAQGNEPVRVEIQAMPVHGEAKNLPVAWYGAQIWNRRLTWYHDQIQLPLASGTALISTVIDEEAYLKQSYEHESGSDTPEVRVFVSKTSRSPENLHCVSGPWWTRFWLVGAYDVDSSGVLRIATSKNGSTDDYADFLCFSVPEYDAAVAVAGRHDPDRHIDAHFQKVYDDIDLHEPNWLALPPKAQFNISTPEETWRSYLGARWKHNNERYALNWLVLCRLHAAMRKGAIAAFTKLQLEPIPRLSFLDALFSYGFGLTDIRATTPTGLLGLVLRHEFGASFAADVLPIVEALEPSTRRALVMTVLGRQHPEAFAIFQATFSLGEIGFVLDRPLSMTSADRLAHLLARAAPLLDRFGSVLDELINQHLSKSSGIAAMLDDADAYTALHDSLSEIEAIQIKIDLNDQLCGLKLISPAEVVEINPNARKAPACADTMDEIIKAVSNSSQSKAIQNALRNARNSIIERYNIFSDQVAPDFSRLLGFSHDEAIFVSNQVYDFVFRVWHLNESFKPVHGDEKFYYNLVSAHHEILFPRINAMLSSLRKAIDQAAIVRSPHFHVPAGVKPEGWTRSLELAVTAWILRKFVEHMVDRLDALSRSELPADIADISKFSLHYNRMFDEPVESAQILERLAQWASDDSV